MPWLICDILGADVDRLGDVERAVALDGDVAVEAEDPLFGRRGAAGSSRAAAQQRGERSAHRR